jgi:hypothetical protein
MIDREIEKALDLPKPIIIGEFEMTDKEKKESEDKLKELIQMTKKPENQQV